MIGMKLSKSTLVFIILFILIIGYSVYNDKIKTKNVKEEDIIKYDSEYTLVDNNYNYKLYSKDIVINDIYNKEYKYIIYDNNKKIINEGKSNNYTRINIIDNILEVKTTYSNSTFSKLFDLDNSTLLLEKENIYTFNNKYVVIIQDDNIVIQDIYNKDKYYKKKNIDKEIINNIKNIKFIKDNKKLRIIYGSKLKNYDIKL